MSCGCLCYVISVFLAVPWFGLQCVIVVFPDHTHFFVFDQVLHQATRLKILVQLFNAESHDIPWNWRCDCNIRFDKLVNRNGYVYVPDNIDTEWHIQFSCDNITLLKATVDSKLLTLHCTAMMAWQCSSDRKLCTTEQQTCKA